MTEFKIGEPIPSFSSIDLNLKVFGVRVDYFIGLFTVLAVPSLLILFLWRDPRAFFVFTLLIPATIFLRIFDNKNNDLAKFGIFLQWLTRRKNYRYWGSLTFLPNMPKKELNYLAKLKNWIRLR